MKRKIIKIDESKCTGCGLCIPDCPEGALLLIDGKARLVSDLFCDGLGACLGACPEDAITIEEREAEPYDEKKVMENIAAKGENTIRAHLKHLLEHGEREYFKQAVKVLRAKNIDVPEMDRGEAVPDGPSPGEKREAGSGARPVSHLGQWPVQLHLVSPQAPFFRDADVTVAADCTAYAYGDFHRRFIKDKSLIIACPKLDSGREEYIQKIKELVDTGGIKSIEVVMMEVPCCRGLLAIVREGLERAGRDVPLKSSVISVKGDELS